MTLYGRVITTGTLVPYLSTSAFLFYQNCHSPEDILFLGLEPLIHSQEQEIVLSHQRLSYVRGAAPQGGTHPFRVSMYGWHTLIVVLTIPAATTRALTFGGSFRSEKASVGTVWTLS